MDLNSKRKLIEVIRGLVSDGYRGTQEDITRELKRRGFNVTQSTVSRVFRKIGVFKEIQNGETVYRIAAKGGLPLRGSLSDLVLGIEHNHHLIVIKTTAGSAMFVAGFIDHELKGSIMGTVAGDDTIFVAPRNTKEIDKAVQALQKTVGI